MKTLDEDQRQVDLQLLTRVATGDQEAFAQLYDRLSPALFSMVLRMTPDEKEAEDILQEGFACIWRQAATYDSSKSAPFTWAVMLMRNRGIDRIRGRERHVRIAQRAMEVHDAETATCDDASEDAIRRERRENVRSALSGIPQEQREAVELAFFGGLTHEEIATRLDAPLGTIKARIRRGLLRLRDKLLMTA